MASAAWPRPRSTRAWWPRPASPSPPPAACAPSTTPRTTDPPARSMWGIRIWSSSAPDVAGVNIAELGPKLQAAFPDGINVEWITRTEDEEGELLDFRVWERGVGETLACGTGSVAAAAAA